MQDQDFTIVNKSDLVPPTKTMSFLEALLCCNTGGHAVPTITRGQLQSAFECDYDANPTQLYQALEKKAWAQVLDFLVEGVWMGSGTFSILFPEKDPLPPHKQASMWVTRFNDGKVQWSQIPLHAAIIYGAPYAVVDKLIELYPQGVRCSDDQGMLPLHLGFKFSTPVTILRLLMEEFPEGMFAKDNRERIPTHVRGDERSKVLSLVMKLVTDRIQKEVITYKNKQVDEIKKELSAEKILHHESETQNAKQSVLVETQKKEIAELKQHLEILTLQHTQPLRNQQQNQSQHQSFQSQPLPPQQPPQFYAQQNNNSSDLMDHHTTQAQIQRLERLIRENKSSTHRHYLQEEMSELNRHLDHNEQLEETSRLNRELQSEKRRLEEQLRKSQKLLFKNQKKQLEDDLQFSRQQQDLLGKKKQSRDRKIQKELENENSKLDRRIKASQDKVNRLLQSKQRVDLLKRDLKDLRSSRTRQHRESRQDSYDFHRTNRENRDTGFDHSESDISEMTPSINGRDIEELRGGLHKLMMPKKRQDLFSREHDIRSKFERLRDCNY